MCYSISLRNTFHSKDLNLDVVPASYSIGNIGDSLLVYLRAVDGKAWCGVELLVTNVTFKVFCLLVEDENFVVIKLTIAVPVILLRKCNLQLI